MSLVIDWGKDRNHRADEARIRQIRQREQETTPVQTGDEERGRASVFQIGLSISLAGALTLFLCSLVWG